MKIYALIYKDETEFDFFDVLDVSKTCNFSTQLHGGFATATFFAPSSPDVAVTRYHTFLGRFVVLVDEYMYRLYEGTIQDVRLSSSGIEIVAAGLYQDAEKIFFDNIYIAYEATTNFIYNPSFEVNVTDNWGFGGGAGAARTQHTTDAKYGTKSCKITQASEGEANAYIYHDVGVTANANYTCSLYAKDINVQGIVYLKLIEKDSGAAVLKTTTKELSGLSPDVWILYEQSITATASTASVEVRIEVESSASPGNVLIDAVQFEPYPYSTGYCDGSLGAGYSWNGTPHQSSSDRAASSPTVADIIMDCIDMVPSWNGTKAHVANATFQVGSRDFTDKKVKESIESMLVFGYSELSITPIYFALWNHGIPHLFPEPGVWKNPDWYVSKQAVVGGNPGISISLANVFNRVYAVYDNQNAGPSKTLAANDLLSQSRYGLREGLVQNGENPEGIAVAEGLRDMALEKFKYPRPVITLEINGFVRSSNGFHTNPAYIRAGQLISLTDLDPISVYNGVSGNGSNGISGLVLRTEYDAASHTMRISFGSADVSYETIAARLGLSGGLV